MKKAAIATLALVLAGAGSASAATVNIWSTNFDGGSVFQTLGPFPWVGLSVGANGAVITGSESFPGFGTDYLRNDGSGVTTFNAVGLGGHSDLHLSFDIAFVDSWDGTTPGPYSPDYLFMTLNGNPYLTVSADNYNNGANENLGPGVLIGRGSYGQNGSFRDAVVHYDLVINDSAPNFTFGFQAGGSGFQYGSDESWGIDNFSLSATPSGTPEPAAWGLMILGFGLAGAAMRRRAARAAL